MAQEIYNIRKTKDIQVIGSKGPHSHSKRKKRI
jgi:hypothetical protein